MKRSVLLLFAAMLSGCAAPKAWERGALASPVMAFDADPLQSSYRDHTFTSKEQSSGGASVGGGGCGCAN